MLKLFTKLKGENLKNMIIRFPIAFTISVVMTILLLIFVNVGSISGDYEKMMWKVIFTFSLVFFLSLGVYLACEDSKMTQSKKSLFQLLPLVFGGLFYYFFQVDFNNYSNISLYFTCLAGISAFVFFAPYVKNFKKGTDNTLYYQYFYRIATVFLFGFALGGLLFLLGVLALSSIQLLFDVSFDKAYGNWAVIALSFIAPVVCLMEIPKDNQKVDRSFKVNSLFSFIFKYVLPIAVFIYFLILYAYTIKVLMNFSDWPKGEVSWLVITFSIVGYITYVLTTYYDDIKAIKLFRKFFPIIVVPQIFMLFYAIYLRIAQYDITINRYFVVVFGIWLLLISLYLIFSKNKSLISIASVLTLFTIIISIGPWGVFTLPETRQLKRLEENLTKAGILANGTIIPLNNYDDIDKELSKQIYDGIQYICYNLDCNSIRELFGEQVKYTDSKWSVVSIITEQIKVRTYYPDHSVGNRYIYISTDNNGVFPIDIEGYEYLILLDSKFESVDTLLRATAIPENTPVIKASINAILNLDSEYISLVDNNNQILENIPTVGLIDAISKKYTDTYGMDADEYSGKYNGLPVADLTYDYAGELYDIRVIVDNYSYIIQGEDGTKTDNYINGYILLRGK